jgi:hypothetical protein
MLDRRYGVVTAVAWTGDAPAEAPAPDTNRYGLANVATTSTPQIALPTARCTTRAASEKSVYGTSAPIRIWASYSPISDHAAQRSVRPGSRISIST